MSDWFESGREPELGEIFEDPIVRVLMESDGTDRNSVEVLLRRVSAHPANRAPELAA